MAVQEYEENGNILWRYYVQKRSSLNPRVRLQRRGSGFSSRKEAEKEERKTLVEIALEVGRLESQGCTWDEIIDRWESLHLLYPSTRYSESTVKDNAQMLRKWTQPWLSRGASELGRADGRLVLTQAEAQGKSVKFCKRLKTTINVVYNWAIEERLVTGVHQSPVKGLDAGVKTQEKLPEILTVEQIKKLLHEAKARKHPWYPVWAFTVLTGCRSGEVHALRKEDVDLINPEDVETQLNLSAERRHFGMIRLQRSWNARLNRHGPLKGRYWRNIPVSSELYELLVGLKCHNFGQDEFGQYLFPRFWEWDDGQQAQVLRMFCKEIGIPSIRFHTLRACFATHLISRGVPSATIMKICGWKELKTMERYVRLAGIDERGATEGLGFIPTDQGVMENVVNMFNFRK